VLLAGVVLAAAWFPGPGSLRSEGLSFPEKTGSAVYAVAFAPRGGQLAVGCADGAAVLLDTRTGQPARAVAAHPQAVTALAFSADGARLATGSNAGAVAVWE